MKKILTFFTYMLAVMVAVPLFIVKSCSVVAPEQDRTLEEGSTITVYIKNEKAVREMEIEEYVKGVTAAEMPAEFNIEALKAQAVAARTNAYKRIRKTSPDILELHDGADICTDYSHCQAWISREAAKERWGLLSSQRYWNKISQAVEETRGMVLSYEGNMIEEPLYHACSAEKTESVQEVFNHKVPYLVSVPTEGDDASPNYAAREQYKLQDFIEKIRKQYPDFAFNKSSAEDQITVLGYTEGDRVKEIRIGNKVFKGTVIRGIFGLRSANFTIAVSGDQVTISTLGDGHGAGMSQWGANSLAKNGENFEGILKHYYQGVELMYIGG